MTRIPAGLTSSVTANNKSFILQTEFVASPANHGGPEEGGNLSSLIKTTVAVEGQVVHKVEKVFIGQIDTEEAFVDAEKAVKVLRNAQSQADLQLEEIEMYGSLVHVVAPDMEHVKRRIKKILRREGIDPGRTAIIEPSLEDVFISCMRD